MGCGCSRSRSSSCSRPPSAGWRARLGLVDEPDERRVHRRPIPRLGGLGLFLGMLVPALAFLAARRETGGSCSVRPSRRRSARSTTSAGSAWWAKLAGQVAAAAIPAGFGIWIDRFTFPFVGVHELSAWVGIPLTIVWIVAIMNMVNFLDGLDGLAAGVCGIAGGTFSVIALSLGKPNAAIVAAIVFGATLGFLRHNFNPARIFMGDSGALLLGFMLAAVSVQGLLKTAATVALFFPLLVLAVPILDTSFVVAKRLKYRQPIYPPTAPPASPVRQHRLLAAPCHALPLGVGAMLAAAALATRFIHPASARALDALADARDARDRARRARRLGLHGLPARDREAREPAHPAASRGRGARAQVRLTMAFRRRARRPSIYEHVLVHLDPEGGLLPGADELPGAERDESGLSWAPGALEGAVSRYASGFVGADSDAQGELAARTEELHGALLAVAERGSGNERKRLRSLLGPGDARAILGPLLARLDEEPPREPERLLAELRAIVRETSDPAELKIALPVLGVLGGPEDAELFRTLARHEEFTLYAASALGAVVDDPVAEWLALMPRLSLWGKTEVSELLLEHPTADACDYLLRHGCSIGNALSLGRSGSTSPAPSPRSASTTSCSRARPICSRR